jgi:hypothetical protein
MRHNQTPTAAVGSEAITAREENAMGDERARRIFLSLVFTAAALLAALEVTLARAGGPMARATAPWVTPLQDMDRALERRDLASAMTARHKAHLAALGSRSWAGFLAVGDAAFRLGDAAGDRRSMEPEARRAYVSALTHARAQRSLDGVLRATEAFALLGDRDMVGEGIRIARELAGSDGEAQARVAALAGQWIGDLL